MDPKKLLQHLNSSTPKALFGSDVEGNYRKYAVMCHPDKFPGNDDATKAFKKLGEMRESLKAPAVTIQSKSRTYEVQKLYAVGDISDVHLATANGIEYYVKVARDSKFNSMMQKEVSAIKGFDKLEKGRAFLPSSTENFTIKGNKAVTVMPYVPHFYTLKQVREKYPDGVPEEHFAWMFKRILGSLVFAHNLGHIHGHITPEHYIIHSEHHGGCLIDWTNHIKKGETLTSIASTYRSFYPPEVFKKQPAGYGLDVYMAGKCGLYLLGDKHTAHPYIRNFLKACTHEEPLFRPDDAFSLHSDFDGILGKVFGKPKFHKFSMEN